MKIIKVKNLKEAVISASLFLPKDNALNNFIALTGGRFGNHFLEHIKSKELKHYKFNISKPGDVDVLF